MIDIEIQGSTQTERLVHLALSKFGPLTKSELSRVVEGAPTHLDRTLNKMLADGSIRKIANHDEWPGGSIAEYLEYKRVTPLRIEFHALTPEQTREWLTPRLTWTRDEDNFLNGLTVDGVRCAGSAEEIRSAQDFQRCLCRLSEKRWLRLGDRYKISSLFPEFSSAVRP
jgi:hypothetical protein